MQELGLVKHAGPDRSLDASWGETKASGLRESTALRLRSHSDQYEASGGRLARSSACTLRCAGCITRTDPSVLPATGGGRDCPRARRGKGSEAGQAVMGEPSRAGQMDDRERLSLSPARRAAELSTAIGHPPPGWRASNSWAMAASVVRPARWISAIAARIVALAFVVCSDRAARARAGQLRDRL